MQVGVRSNEDCAVVVFEHRRIDGRIALAENGINVLSAKQVIFLMMLQRVRYEILLGWILLALR
jgi:hypothetical protein